MAFWIIFLSYVLLTTDTAAEGETVLCEDPERYLSAELVDSHINEYTVNTVLTYKCRSGFEEIPGIDKSITCSENGTWTKLGDFCKRKDCGAPPSLQNGKVKSEGTTFGSKMLVSCDEGYQLVGKNEMTCLVDGWEKGNLQCVPKDCGPLPDLPHGTVKSNSTTFGSRMLLSCEEGYQLVGKKEKTCLSDGWEKGNISCIHRLIIGVNPTRLPADKRTTDMTLGTNDHEFSSKSVGGYNSSLMDGNRTAGTILGSTEGFSSESVGGHNSRLLDGNRTAGTTPGSTEGTSHVPWVLLLCIPLIGFLCCFGGLIFMIYMKKCRGSYYTNESKGSPQSQRSSYSANGEQTSLAPLTPATV